ncbi:hypothetical protein CEXT_788331 [Caerostris extrusa]|uniref:Uncharacterized protein n=1 Tax=Caerostris extrusa TaxID=172846 RepID=A0AAV4UBK7_CAEEX|nr:hypothetical protein CEXT_788331 [Caerostris extrusa]
MMRNTLASRPYTVPPRDYDILQGFGMVRILKDRHPLCIHTFKTHPTVGYTPTLVNSWFQPQPTYLNNPKWFVYSTDYELSKLFTFYVSTAEFFFQYLFTFSHNPCIQNLLPVESARFYKCPKRFNFSKMLDDPEGFRAVTPTIISIRWDTLSTCQTTRKRTLCIIWSPDDKPSSIRASCWTYHSTSQSIFV